MKLFIFELVSAGGMGPEPPAGLLAEGLAMLTALVEDFERVPGVETLTLLNEACGVTVGKSCRQIGPGKERHAFMEMVALADAVLIIAPESDDLLAERSSCVLAAGKRLLGSTPAAIDLTGDKLALARHFTQHGIPTPATDFVGRARWTRYPAVCKPRFGAGSQATFLVQNESLLPTQIATAQRELPEAEFLMQPFVPGQPASVLFLIGPKQQLALQPATQRLSADGRFRYLGGMVPLHPDLARRAVSLARRAVATVVGLGGPVGVDLVLGEAVNGSLDSVIEINPRLTTSYVGLRQLALDNLAMVLLQIAQGESPSPMRWGKGPLYFSTVAT